MKNIIIAHGFNVKDGGNRTIDKLIPFIPRIYSIQEADYGWTGLFGVRFFNDNFAHLIASMAMPESVGIGHSNGCALLYKATLINEKIKTLVLINPALDSDVVFPKHIERVLVLHNVYDKVVTQSSLLPWHIWGNMGRVGYSGDDTRVENFETSKLFGVAGHSSIFSDDSITSVADFILDKIIGI